MYDVQVKKNREMMIGIPIEPKVSEIFFLQKR